MKQKSILSKKQIDTRVKYVPCPTCGAEEPGVPEVPRSHRRRKAGLLIWVRKLALADSLHQVCGQVIRMVQVATTQDPTLADYDDAILCRKYMEKALGGCFTKKYKRYRVTIEEV